MWKHCPRTRWLSWWQAFLLVSAALLAGGWWLSHPGDAPPSAQARRTLADEASPADLGTCQSYLDFETSTCTPRFPLHLSPPLGQPLDMAQLEDVLTAGSAYNSALYDDSGLQPFARLSALRAPWGSALDTESVASAAASVSFRRFVVLVNGALRPHGFRTLEHCWDGRLNPCAGSPERWTGWLRLRHPFTHSRFVALLEDALPRLHALIGAATELRAPASAAPEAPREVTVEAAPVRFPKGGPPREATLSACPPRRSCETEQRQLTVALETNLHLSQSLEHLTEAPSSKAEPVLRRVAQLDADGGTPWRLTIPAKPFKWQKPPPCNPDRGEEAINGACWIETKTPAPCAELAEHNGKCYIPVEKRQSAPPQSETRDGETH